MVIIKSKIGGRSENQDFSGTSQFSGGEVIILCDGVGGHSGGRFAAELAVNTILSEISKSEIRDITNSLKSAIKKANAAIWKVSQSDPQLRRMGTTVVTLLLTPDKAICCHAGDSRLYHLRDGKILFRTYDHSHVFELVSAGLITEEQARISDKSNIITRGLGIQSAVDLDIRDNILYEKGDRFLLCTDGIWGAIQESKLVEIVCRDLSVEHIAKELIEMIDDVGFANGGGHDNMTLALLEIDSVSTTKRFNPLKNEKSSIFSIFKALIKSLKKYFKF